MRLALRFLFIGLAGSALLAPAAARAQTAAAGVVVVEAPPNEPGMDAARLRADVGVELGADAVAPDDPRAAQASGTVRVSVDHAAHALVVEYRGRAEPIRRTVDLPADAADAEHAAVLLAGNLARDEAGELAASLRKPKPPPPPETRPDVAQGTPDDEEHRELDFLGTTLANDSRWSGTRRTLADVTMGVGFGAVAASAGLTAYGLASGTHGWPDVEAGLVQAWAGLMVASYVLRPGDFGELNTLYARGRAEGWPPGAVVDDVEQAWLRAARSEHRNRRLIGWLTVGSSVILTVFAGSAAAGAVREPSLVGPLSVSELSGFSTLGGLELAMGINLVVADGPVESALHRYEKTVGWRVKPESAALVPFVAPVAGAGGVVGLGGRF
jgi:hypothetical protein